MSSIQKKRDHERVRGDVYRIMDTKRVLIILICMVASFGYFIHRAVKLRPSGRRYKAHLDWNFCFQSGVR